MELRIDRPMQDRVLIERVEPARKVGSIILPDHAQRTHGLTTANIKDRAGFEGIVRAVGRGRISKKGVLLAPPVNVGDRVILHRQTYGDNVAAQLGVEGEWLLLTPDAIEGVIEEGTQFKEMSLAVAENENAKEAARGRTI